MNRAVVRSTDGMNRRWLGFLAAVAAVAAVAANVGSADPSRRTAVPGARTAARTVYQATTRSATALPFSCFVAAGTCSIHPCVEFVARQPPTAQMQPLRRARITCDSYASPRGQLVPIRR